MCSVPKRPRNAASASASLFDGENWGVDRCRFVQHEAILEWIERLHLPTIGTTSKAALDPGNELATADGDAT